jgi:hypothetical protein
MARIISLRSDSYRLSTVQLSAIQAESQAQPSNDASG